MPQASVRASEKSERKPDFGSEYREATTLYLQSVATRALSESGLTKTPSLAGGLCGQALLFTYIAEAHKDHPELWPRDLPGDPGSTCIELLNRAVDAAAEEEPHPALFAGLSGLAWVSAHVQKRLGLDDQEGGTCATVDGLLLEILERSALTVDFELYLGLAGIAVYALERLPQAESADRILGLILERFEKMAIRPAIGKLSWFTPGDRVPIFIPGAKPIFAKGFFNLGTAHGVPGILAVLARMKTEWASAKAIHERIDALLDPAIQWLDEVISAHPDGLPNWLCEGQEPPVRPTPAWCYGDLGVAAALAMMSKSLGRPDIRRMAQTLGDRAAANRKRLGDVIADLGICHGEMGTAHLMTRTAAHLGEDRYGEQVRSCLRHVLHALESNRWQMPQVPQDTSKEWTPMAFLQGESGLALALISAAFPIEPSWDSLLLAGAGTRKVE